MTMDDDEIIVYKFLIIFAVYFAVVSIFTNNNLLFTCIWENPCTFKNSLQMEIIKKALSFQHPKLPLKYTNVH